MCQVMERYERGFTVPPGEQVEMGKQSRRFHLKEVCHLGVVPKSGAVMGARGVSGPLGNIPDRETKLNTCRASAISRPQPFIFKRQR